jgi:hypothetical protein
MALTWVRVGRIRGQEPAHSVEVGQASREAVALCESLRLRL